MSRELNKDNVCAIVVAYEPDEHSIQCISGIAKHASRTLVVDNNSSANRFAHLGSIQNERLEIIRNPENTGVAGGLNRGISEAQRRGFGWFLLFDQDTEIYPNAIDCLIEAFRSCPHSDKVGVQGATFLVRRADGAIEEAPSTLDPAHLWKEEEVVITSGSLISDMAYKAIGPFRDEYFIDFVDYEYCLRAQKKGFSVIKSLTPVMIHRLGNITRVNSPLALGKQRYVSNYSPLRRYYATRNLILLQREYRQSHPRLFKDLFKQLRTDVRLIVKYEPQKWAKLRAMLTGFLHGRRGLAGRREQIIPLRPA